MMDKEVEAILFAAGRVVTLQELSTILDISEPGLIKEAVKDIKRRYEEQDSPLFVEEEGEGFKIAVKEKYISIVHKINPHTELLRGVMETLAVISWKQPVLQSELIRIRSTKAYEHIQELEDKGFIQRARHGRSFLIKTTQKFLDYFDLPNKKAVDELFKEFKDVAAQTKLAEGAAGQEQSPQEGTLTQETPSLDPSLEVYDRPADVVEQDVMKATQQSQPKPLITEDAFNGLELYTVEEKEQKKKQEPIKQEFKPEEIQEIQIKKEEQDLEETRRLAKKLLEESELTQDNQEEDEEGSSASTTKNIDTYR